MFGFRREGKLWGTTSRVTDSERSIICIINVVKGGYCSKHFHESKDNMFVVTEGSLVVRQWDNLRDDSEYFDTVLEPSSGSLTVPCKKLHKFYSPDGCKAIEVYVSSYPDLVVKEEDIVRVDKGGIGDGI